MQEAEGNAGLALRVGAEVVEAGQQMGRPLRTPPEQGCNQMFLDEAGITFGEERLAGGETPSDERRSIREVPETTMPG